MNLKHTPIQIGDLFETTQCGTCVVRSIEGNGTSKDYCIVEFTNTKYQRRVRVSELRRGHVRDPYVPTALGIGYLGEGPYKGGDQTCYNAWRSMLERCYGSRQCNSYELATVDPIWHNFQNFAEWFHKHYVKDYHLDKDLKVPNNVIYGPDTCIYVPKSVNWAEATLRTAVTEHIELQPMYDSFRQTILSLYDTTLQE